MSKSPMKTGKQPAKVKLLRKLAETLAVISAMGAVPEARGPQEALVEQILGLLRPSLPEMPQALGDLLATGHPRIINEIAPALHRLRLEPYQWRRLLKAANPNTIQDLVVQRKLLPAGSSPHVFSRIAAKDNRWEFLLAPLGEPDHLILDRKYRDLLANPAVTPIAATYLSHQVSSFPGFFHSEACSRASQRDPYVTRLLVVAGVDLEKLRKNANKWNPVLHHLTGKLRSNHALLKFFRKSPSVEATLRNHQALEEDLLADISHIPA